MASIKEVFCKNCGYFYPTPVHEFHGQPVNGLCNSESGAEGPINGDKSPFDNIAFFITPSEGNGPAFPIGNISWAKHMLADGTTCYKDKPAK
jgi:hypothetical protein